MRQWETQTKEIKQFESSKYELFLKRENKKIVGMLGKQGELLKHFFNHVRVTGLTFTSDLYVSNQWFYNFILFAVRIFIFLWEFFFAMRNFILLWKFLFHRENFYFVVRIFLSPWKFFFAVKIFLLLWELFFLKLVNHTKSL